MGMPKKRLGRRPAAGETRTCRIAVVFTAYEYQRIREAAGKQPLAAWVRGLVIDQVAR